MRSAKAGLLVSPALSLGRPRCLRPQAKGQPQAAVVGTRPEGLGRVRAPEPPVGCGGWLRGASRAPGPTVE